MSEGDWKEWDVFCWNEKLFLHYFSVHDDESPVTSLCVTAEELRRVAGESEMDADSVQLAFFNKLNKSLGAEKNGTAFENRMNQSSHHPGPETKCRIPSKFVFLVASCLAANQVLEDEENLTTNSTIKDFRDVLAKLLDVVEVAISKHLAHAWEDIADFLDSEPLLFPETGGVIRLRKLVLPDPGNETHIGYSKRLVFPSRRDQKKLVEKLIDSGLIEEDPRVDDVLGLVSKSLNDFSAPFQLHFKVFRDAVRDGENTSRLSSSMFWSAVVTACSNEILLASNLTTRFGLLCDSSGGSDYFHLVSNGATPSQNFVVASLDDVIEGWSSKIALEDADVDVVSSVLEEPTGLGALASLIRGGVIPFRQRDDYFFEATSKLGRFDSDLVLIKESFEQKIRDVFDPKGRASFRNSPYLGWVIAENIKLRTFSKEELVQIDLADVSVLQRRIFRPSLKVHSLFRIGDECLGWGKLLPTFSAPGANQVSLTVEGREIPLTSKDDVWSINEDNLLGRATVTAQMGEQRIIRDFQFVAVPASDSYQLPSDPGSWLIETNHGMSVLEKVLNSETSRGVSEISETSHRIFYGPRPGEFLESVENSIIEVTYFGESISVVVHADLDAELDTSEVADKGLRRRWREKLHTYSESSDISSDVKATLRKLEKLNLPRKSGVKIVEIAPRAGYSVPPTPYEDKDSIAAMRTVLLSAVGFRSLRRKGISLGQWIEMIKNIFDVDRHQARFVHRGWLESGLIDEFISARSPGSTVFARRPRLEIFKSEEGYVGGIGGLVMPDRFDALAKLATSMGLLAAVNFGPSAFVPPHLRLRSTDMGTLMTFAAEASLEVCMVAATPFEDFLPLEKGSAPERGYSQRKSHPTFTQPASVEVSVFSSIRSPMIWKIDSGSKTSWTYSSAHSEHLAMALSGESNLEQLSEVDVRVKFAFIPLMAARWLTMVSGIPSGPISENRYLYRFPSPVMKSTFINSYNESINSELKFWQG